MRDLSSGAQRLQATLNPRVQGSWDITSEPPARFIYLIDMCLLCAGQQEKSDTALQSALRRRKDLLQRLWVGQHSLSNTGPTPQGLTHRPAYTNKDALNLWGQLANVCKIEDG
jgi:hypothetical protein